MIISEPKASEPYASLYHCIEPPVSELSSSPSPSLGSLWVVMGGCAEAGVRTRESARDSSPLHAHDFWVVLRPTLAPFLATILCPIMGLADQEGR